ncbi:MAG: sugar ABC transporter ATP-binding protein [Nitrospira sp.]|nr:sugar ABC transporter ATP-binding protein [Nitrospira sp.]
MSVARLRLTGICKRFGATLALKGVDLEVRAGEIHGVIGENGAGKSTLMKILAGVVSPDSGGMELEGEPFCPANPLSARRAGVVMVNQELAIAPHLSVVENIALGAEPGGFLLNHRKARAKARDALTQLGRADIPLDQQAGRLSVAEQQLVEIARALALGCRVLVLDEPTSSLTATDAAALFRRVRALRDQGQSIIYISHFLEEVQELTDRCTVLRDGLTVSTCETAQTNPSELARAMIGRSVDELYVRSARTPGEVILRAVDVKGALRNVSASLELRRGEVLGIAGLVGAGRSEFLRILFGLDELKSGLVDFRNNSHATTPMHRWRNGMGMLSEDRKSEGLALNLSLEENLTLPRLDAWLGPKRLEAETREWIRRLEVRCAGPHQAAVELSGGNQQKIALGRLLRNECEVLLLDEPTRGVDLGAKQSIYRLIDELAASGKAVIMVSSYLPELLGTCDRIAVMCRGTLGAVRPVGEWDAHGIMLAATGASTA